MTALWFLKFIYPCKKNLSQYYWDYKQEELYITCFINNKKQTPLFLVDHLEKTFLAFLTRKCFLSRMSSKVSLVIVWKGKWLRTLLTGKGFLSSISSLKCSYLETFMTWHEMTQQRLGEMFARNLFLFSRSMASLMGFCNSNMSVSSTCLIQKIQNIANTMVWPL